VPDVPISAEATDPTTRSCFGEHHALLDLLAGLPAERREAFVATQLLGLSYAEAAQVCDYPVGTIRSRVASAGEHLVTAWHSDRPAASRNAG
jgi:RNA polymerase sigma-70 factor (ECF subfamily)